MDTLSSLSLGLPCLYLRPPLIPLPSFPASLRHGCQAGRSWLGQGGGGQGGPVSLHPSCLLPPSGAAQGRWDSSVSPAPGRLPAIPGHRRPPSLSSQSSFPSCLLRPCPCLLGSITLLGMEDGEVREKRVTSSCLFLTSS